MDNVDTVDTMDTVDNVHTVPCEVRPGVLYANYVDEKSACNGIKMQCIKMRPSLFCDFTQRRLVVSYRRFGTTHRSHLQGSSGPRRTYCA